MPDTTNKHLGNVLSTLSDEDVAEVIKQWAKKKDCCIKQLLNYLNDVYYCKCFDYCGEMMVEENELS